MKKYSLLLFFLYLSGCGVNEPVIEPLNGVYESSSIEGEQYFIPVEMHLLETLESNAGEVYGGKITGSGGFEFSHFWFEFRITSGVTDRKKNTFRFTFETENVNLDGQLTKFTGVCQGSIINRDLLTGKFIINDMSRMFNMNFKKV